VLRATPKARDATTSAQGAVARNHADATGKLIGRAHVHHHSLGTTRGLQRRRRANSKRKLSSLLTFELRSTG
jgi:hypothetical protein